MLFHLERLTVYANESIKHHNPEIATLTTRNAFTRVSIFTFKLSFPLSNVSVTCFHVVAIYITIVIDDHFFESL